MDKTHIWPKDMISCVKVAGILNLTSSDIAVEHTVWTISMSWDPQRNPQMLCLWWGNGNNGHLWPFHGEDIWEHGVLNHPHRGVNFKPNSYNILVWWNNCEMIELGECPSKAAVLASQSPPALHFSPHLHWFLLWRCELAGRWSLRRFFFCFTAVYVTSACTWPNLLNLLDIT